MITFTASASRMRVLIAIWSLFYLTGCVVDQSDYFIFQNTGLTGINCEEGCEIEWEEQDRRSYGGGSDVCEDMADYLNNIPGPSECANQHKAVEYDNGNVEFSCNAGP